MIRLDSNTDLYNYLLSLAKLLESTSAAHLVANLQFAAQHAAALRAGLPTEFLGESLIALRKVLDEEKGALKSSDREDLVSVIDQVDFVLKRNAPTGPGTKQ